MKKFDCIADPLPRKTPWCNLVEKAHDFVKSFLMKNPRSSLRDCQIHMNKLPFTQISFTSSPYELYTRANSDLISKYQQEISEKSKTRTKKQIEKRGKNIANFSRNFQVGDLVKSNKLNSREIDFGIVSETKGSKFITIKTLDKNKIIHAHSSDIIKIPFTISLFKKFL